MPILQFNQSQLRLVKDHWGTIEDDISYFDGPNILLPPAEDSYYQ